MGKDLAQNYRAAAEIFERADHALGFKLSELCFNGPVEDLQLTENTQPAILTVSMAAYSALKEVMGAENFLKADCLAGHSLGEYSALVAAGSLSFEDAVRVVRKRGRYMQEAVPVGVGAMAAIIGKGNIEAAVRKACRQAVENHEGAICSPANINAPHQVVISGHTEAVERAMRLLQEDCPNVRRAMKLNVSAPFHCKMMQPVEELLAKDLRAVKFARLETPLLVTDVDNPVHVEDGETACKWLIKQVSSPVKWKNAVSHLVLRDHVGTFVEIGPGKVLTALVRHTASEALTLHVEDQASLEATSLRLLEVMKSSERAGRMERL
jgi:[acyl-carrier-protein] S-malonyltransferase